MASTLYSSNEVAASDSHANDRNNLLLLTRLVLRGLLEHCMQANNRMLAADTPQLQHLFIMVEKVLRHGFKYAAQRTLITLKTPEMELWNLIERIGRTSKEIEESVSCVQQLPHISSPICRVRAWLRLAVMQKKLSDYFQALVENKLLLRECYEDWALLRHETTGVVMAGSLIGLSVIDCNLFLREDDLSRQALSVDLNMYIKIPTVLIDSEDDEEDEENAKKKSMDRLAKEAADELKNILDQKNYLEELNRQLAANVTNLKLRLARYEVGLGSKSASVSEV
uniref:RUN domain-containing protein n=1 Tax=Plectus sambesii TaxID=2011161 RepID=A0A914WTN3_9BILA